VFPFLCIDLDNGSKFTNKHLLAYRTERQITCTRARPVTVRAQDGRTGRLSASLDGCCCRPVCRPPRSRSPPGWRRLRHPGLRTTLEQADKPAAYWTMGSPRSGIDKDRTGHGQTGTYFGRPAATKLPNGDTAADFDGKTEYLQVKDAAALSTATAACSRLRHGCARTRWNSL
jgi:hypothetical protein